jgi:predicted alpha/beta hydrolase family esterase
LSSNFLARLADRLILQPSRNPIDPEGRRREVIATPHGEVEAWVTTIESLKTEHPKSQLHVAESSLATFANQESGAAPSPYSKLPITTNQIPATTNFAPSPNVISLKFPGVAGRAERSGLHPFELIPFMRTETWGINPIGYGGSQGTASLSTIAPTCEAVWKSVIERYPATPVFLVGNSLGCLNALYLAARKNVAGVYLRNPVPLSQLISGRLKYNWWNFGCAARLARQIPVELNAIENARMATAPMLMVSSENDRICPWRFQELVWKDYSGNKTLIVLQGVDHHESVPESQVETYRIRTSEFLSQTLEINQVQ